MLWGVLRLDWLKPLAPFQAKGASQPLKIVKSLSRVPEIVHHDIC